MKVIIQIICFMALTVITGHAQEAYTVTNKCGGIVIPRLLITNATLPKALGLLQEAYGRNSPNKDTTPGIIVKVNDPEENPALFTNSMITLDTNNVLITLVTNNVLFFDAVVCVASQANYEIETIVNSVIVLHPKKKKEKQVEP